MKEEIKAVVFDVGGVLIEGIDIKEFWKGIPETRELRDKFGAGKISEKEFVLRGASLLEVSKDEFYKKYKKAYSIIKPKEKVITIFRKIKIDKYILSDTNPIAVITLKKLLFEEIKMTKEVLLSHEIGLRKIDPETFNFLIKKIGINPHNILFIDDLAEHIERAKKAGITTILFKNSLQLKRDLKKLKVK